MDILPTWAVQFGHDENVKKKIVKVGSGHVLLCREVMHEGVDSNQSLPLQCKLCMNINDVYFDKSDLFIPNLHQTMAFVLTSTVQVNIQTLQCLRNNLLGYCGFHILKGAQRISCFYLVDHTSILLIF